MAGYSKTPLAQKLGIKAGMRLVVLSAPVKYENLTQPLPAGIRLSSRLSVEARFVHLFTRSRSELERRFPVLAKKLADDGILWISWPKQASGVQTDLNEGVVRRTGLQSGLVDVKVCAVDDTWSGLKFVRRLRDRAAR